MKFAKLTLLGIILAGCGKEAIQVVDALGSLSWRDSGKEHICMCMYIPSEGFGHVCRDADMKIHREVNCWTGEVSDGGTK